MDVFVSFESPDGTITRKIEINSNNGSIPIKMIIKPFLDSFSQFFQFKDESSIKVYYINSPTYESLYPKPTLITNLDEPINNFQSFDETTTDFIISYKIPEITSYAPIEYSDSTQTSPHDNISPLFDRFKQSLQIRNFLLSYKLYQEIKSFNPDSVIVHICHIMYLLKTRRFKDAVQSSLSAISIFPTERECQLLYAISLQKIGDHQEAITNFTHLNLFKPLNFEESQYYIAKSLYKLGSLDHALTLVQPIVNSNPNNINAKLLLANIFAKKGCLVEAIHIAIQIFQIHPDHKRSRKFIGQHIHTHPQANLLAGELGENVSNPTSIFFISDLLYQSGSFQPASSYYTLGLEKCHDPAFGIGAIINLLASSSPFSLMIDVFQQFLPMTFKDQQQIKIDDHLSKLLEIPPMQNQPYRAPSFKFNKIIFGTKEPDFTMDDLNKYWFAMLLEQCLFRHGNISAASTVGQRILNEIKDFNMEETSLDIQLEVFKLEMGIIPSISLPLPQLPPIYIIGDYHVIPFAWRSIHIMDKGYSLIPFYINGDTRSIIKKKCCSESKAFEESLANLPKDAKIIVDFGRIGESASLPNFFSDSSANSDKNESLEVNVDDYVKTIQNIQENRDIVVMPVLEAPELDQLHIKSSEKIKIILQYNNMLKGKISSTKLKIVNFSDIFNENGLNEEYTFDDKYLSPIEANISRIEAAFLK